jgi:hypothetical protein
MKDRGIQIGRYLTPEGRSRGGLNGAKVRRQNGVARRLDAVRHLLPAWLTDECDDSERARLLALLCRTYQRGFTQGRRQRDKTRKAAMRRTA